jgi:transcriptional regulator with XRE-family HTH domain
METKSGDRRTQVRLAFGASLRTLRHRAKIPQEALAHDAGIDRGYMSGLERGLHNPTLETLVRVAPALGVTLHEFITEFEAAMRRHKRNRA